MLGKKSPKREQLNPLLCRNKMKSNSLHSPFSIFHKVGHSFVNLFRLIYFRSESVIGWRALVFILFSFMVSKLYQYLPKNQKKNKMQINKRTNLFSNWKCFGRQLFVFCSLSLNHNNQVSRLFVYLKPSVPTEQNHFYYSVCAISFCNTMEMFMHLYNGHKIQQ